MRRLVLVCALLVAGCGVLDDDGPAGPAPLDPAVYGPTEAPRDAQPDVPVPPLRTPPAAVGRRLDRGAVGVVDPGGTVSIEPRVLATASDVTLEDLTWSKWDEKSATGAGAMSLLTCDPTCASGSVVKARATIELTGVKTCGGRRYFERGRVVADAPDAPNPATYLRAPC